MVTRALERVDRFRKHGGLDGFALCSDCCLNIGPFLSPAQFNELVTPYLAELIQGYRDMGFYVIKHTVKPAEDGTDDVIVCLYECKRSTTKCRLSTLFSFTSAARTNILEAAEDDLAIHDGSVVLTFRPFEIKTLRMRVGN